VKALLRAIVDVIRPDFYRDGVVRLEETAAGSTCGPVTLNKSGPAVVLKLDGLPPPLCAQPGCQLRYSVNDRLFPLFKTETAGLSALCDYLIFYPEKDVADPRLFVFLCELKSGRPSGSKKQAENGKLLADYILAMARHHHKLSEIPRYEARGLVFSPRFGTIKIANPARDKMAYVPLAAGIPGMKFGYCRPGDYPLAYFCA
jgi:hypothetical protein